MKTSKQEVFAAAALTGTKPTSGIALELFNLSDVEGLREYPNVPQKCSVQVLCEITTVASVTEVSMGVEVSDDGTEWYPTQTGTVSGVKLALVDDQVSKVVSSNGQRWEFQFKTVAPYVRFLPWASNGTPAGSSFTAKAIITKD